MSDDKKNNKASEKISKLKNKLNDEEYIEYLELLTTLQKENRRLAQNLAEKVLSQSELIANRNYFLISICLIYFVIVFGLMFFGTPTDPNFSLWVYIINSALFASVIGFSLWSNYRLLSEY